MPRSSAPKELTAEEVAAQAEELAAEREAFELEKAALEAEKQVLEDNKSQLEADKVAAEEASKVAAAAKPPVSVLDTEKKFKDDAEKTGYFLSLQPKVTTVLPLGEGETEGAFEVVTINGYQYVVKKGEIVELPASVAEIINNKYRIQQRVATHKASQHSDQELKDAGIL